MDQNQKSRKNLSKLQKLAYENETFNINGVRIFRISIALTIQQFGKNLTQCLSYARHQNKQQCSKDINEKDGATRMLNCSSKKLFT